MKIGLFCRPHQLPGGDVTHFAEAARLADEAGLYSIHLGEHLAMGQRPDRYPFGEFVHTRDVPWVDPMIALATAAAVTTRIRLSTGILLAPLRSGASMAKSLASLDVLSHGRVEPGLGIGWQREEFATVGVPWEKRYARFDEVLRTCRQFWGPQPVHFEAADGEVLELDVFPRPVQERIPLLLGIAPTPKNIARIVEYADGWCPVRLTPDQLAEGVTAIRQAFEEAGRDPSSLIVRTQASLVLKQDGRINVPATLDGAAAYEEAGATILAVGPTVGCQSMDDVAELVQELGSLAGTAAVER